MKHNLVGSKLLYKFHLNLQILRKIVVYNTLIGFKYHQFIKLKGNSPFSIALNSFDIP